MTDQNNTTSSPANGQSGVQTDQLIKELDSLADEAVKLDEEIDQTNASAHADLDAINSKVDSSIKKLDGIYAELDKIDEEVSDEVDKLVLQQTEDALGE